ncbi:MAG: 3'-5' exonuclease, partial [Bacteroidota bacterium]|nr:3'-5' exonuclease [Bacteroidota bacterium]
VISDEALYVKNAPIVKLILAILNYLRKPTDENLKRMALMEYAIWMNPGIDAADDFFKNNGGEADFPQEVKAELKEVVGLPLYEMCERLVALFMQSGNDSDNVFLQAFQDMVLDFSGRKSADLIAFLDWWQESGVKKTISMPDSQDAIRIMTIHKSKGLGFKAVLIPFCDWDIDQKPNNILWCEPKVAPFDEIPLLPIPYNKSLADSIFAFEYFEEKIHSYIDNLNVAYVAFTRAKEEMVAFCPKSEKEETKRLGGVLHFCINHSSEYMMEDDSEREFISLNSNYSEEQLAYEDGVEWKPQIKRETKSGEQKMANYRSVNPDGRLQLRLRNRDFFAGTEERRYGNLMHDILSRIVVIDDVEDAVQELVFAGEITTEKGAEITAHLYDLLDNPEIAPWFSPEATVKNEVQILQPDGAFYRPDRVVVNGNQVIVVDFKFGTRKDKKYHKQVSRYMSLISQMKYESVKGYLWFVELGEVEEV